MNEIKLHDEQGWSRRRALIGMAAAASSLLTGSAWSKPTTASNWPLWVIEGDGGRAYLFGETPARAKAWHDARIEALLPKCSALWTETNGIWRGKPQELMGRHGIDKTTALLTKLSTTGQAQLIKAAALAKMPLASLAPFRPWAAAMTLEGAYYNQLHLAESGSAEKVLTQIAKKAGITVSSEFAAQDDVVAYMGGMTAEQEAGFLGYTLEQILLGPVERERIYTDWSRGETASTERVVAQLKTNYPAMYDSIVIGRNQGWVPRFKEMLRADKPAMTAVGLYHMVGPDSLIVQLQAAGLTVKLM